MIFMENEKSLCACGCSVELPKRDYPIRYIYGHSVRGRKRTYESRTMLFFQNDLIREFDESEDVMLGKLGGMNGILN